MPCRDAAAHIDEALTSIENQSFHDFELIVIDDGSRDATPAIVTRHADRDPRIRLLNAGRHGIVDALVTGCAAATGRIIARMDADDIAYPQRIERQVRLLDSRPDIALCGTGVRYFPDDDVRDGARLYEQWINALIEPADIERDLFVECPVPHPTFALRRETLDAVGGYRHTDGPEDYDLVLRIASAGGLMAKPGGVLLDWREGPNRLSRTDPRYSPDAFRRCKARFLGPLRVKGRDIVVWGAGPVGKAFALALREQGHVIRAFVDLDPRKIGQTIHDAPVVDPSGIRRFRGCYALAAVGSTVARTEIKAALDAAGWAEVVDYCAVA
jgi:glycosyltransferase involved in cell wall biosynthesis